MPLMETLYSTSDDKVEQKWGNGGLGSCKSFKMNQQSRDSLRTIWPKDAASIQVLGSVTYNTSNFHV